MAERTFSTLERYELKYHINVDMIGFITDFLRPYCSLDSYSEKSPDHFYWVSTLYLDSPARTFFNWKEKGIERRFNMRIRTYGEDPTPDGPRFYEIKHKAGDIVLKTRGTLLGGHAERLWTQVPEVLANANTKDRKHLESFYRLSTTWNAEPKLMTQYRRLAWFGLHEDYARVTVDVGMRWREERSFNMACDPMRMSPSDLPDYFSPGANAVLEMKCPKAQVPWWMLDLIRALNLSRTSFSKFGVATREYLRLPGYRISSLQPFQETYA